MKIFCKHTKEILIAAMSLIAVFCIFFITISALAENDSDTANVRVDFIQDGDFENFTLTNGYLDFPSNSVNPNFANMSDGGTAGFVKDAYTANSTAARYQSGYLMYSFKSNILGAPVAGIDYNVSFDAAAGNVSSANNFLAGFTPAIVLYYTNTDGQANQVKEFTVGEAGSGLFYAKCPEGASASEATWNDISFSFNFTIDGENNFVFNSTWGEAALTKTPSLAAVSSNRVNYTAATNVKSVQEMQLRIKAPGNKGISYLYVDNVEAYTEFDVGSELLNAFSPEKTAADGELISDGNMSAAAAAGTEYTSTTAINALGTVYIVPGSSTSSIIQDAYSGSKAIEVNSGGYINIRVSDMLEGSYYDFSYDVKLKTSSTEFNKIGSVYNSIVLYDVNTFFAESRLEANEDGTANVNARIFPITKQQQTWGKYFLNNFQSSSSETYVNMYSGKDFCDWSTVTYRIWYEYNSAGEVVLHCKRMTDNSSSAYSIYSNQGSANPELSVNLGSHNVYSSELRIRCDLGPVLIDNLSLKEAPNEYDATISVVDGAGVAVEGASVTLMKQGGAYTTDGNGQVIVHAQFSDYAIVRKDGYMLSQKMISASKNNIEIVLSGEPDFDYVNNYGNVAVFGDFESTRDFYSSKNIVEYDAFMEYCTNGDVVSLSEDALIGDYSLMVEMGNNRGTRCAFRANQAAYEYGVKYWVSGYVKTTAGATFTTKPTVTCLYKEYNDGDPVINAELDSITLSKEPFTVTGEWQYFEYWFEINLEDCEDWDVEPITVENANWSETFDKVLTVRTSYWDTLPLPASAIFYEQMYIEPSLTVFKGQTMFIDGVTILPEYEAQAKVYLNENQTDESLSFTVTDYLGNQSIYTDLTSDGNGVYSFGTVRGPVTVVANLNGETYGTQVTYFMVGKDNSTVSFYPDFDCSVSVVDQEGKAILGASVTTWVGGNKITLEDSENKGIYSAAELDGSLSYYINVSAEGYVSGNCTVTFTNNNATVTLQTKDVKPDENPGKEDPSDTDKKTGCKSSAAAAAPFIGICLCGYVAITLKRKKHTR